MKQPSAVVSEAEAKTKICPFLQQPNAEWQHCMGSKCMAWRWQSPTLKFSPAQLPLKLQPTPEPRGYCGLVGQTFEGIP